MKRLISKFIKILVGEWVLFLIYKKNIAIPSSSSFANENQAIVFRQKKLADQYIKFYLVKDDKELCSLGVIWGKEYKENFRNYIPLKTSEAKIIDVITHSEFRGKGYIAKLFQEVEKEMRNRKINTLVARIWHSNESSKRAFEKSKWSFVGFKVELKLLKLLPLTFKYLNR